MAHKISEIKDMDPQIVQKLKTANVDTVEELLAKTGSPAQRNAMAKELGVTSSALTEWINRADLMRLKGVGKEMANLLEECGVDSVKELQHRRADNLHAALKKANDEKKITHHAPSLAQVEAWIAESRLMAAGAA